MKKTIWMDPEGELIECLSHNEYAIELISNSEETKELNIDYDYPYQLLHKLGWVRIDINSTRSNPVTIYGDAIDLCKPMRSTLDPKMNEIRWKEQNIFVDNMEQRYTKLLMINEVGSNLS